MQNPIKYYDPNGRIAVVDDAIIIAAVAAIAAGSACYATNCGEAIVNAFSELGEDISDWWRKPSEVRALVQDPAKVRPVNPGRDCDGNCLPCPPNLIWPVEGAGHGYEHGVWHEIVWNQNPETCMCYPDRPSRGLAGW